MSKMCVKVDLDLCQGHSVCQAEAPEVFRVVDNDEAPYPQVEVILEYPPEALREKVKRAESFCPNGVIRVVEVEE